MNDPDRTDWQMGDCADRVDVQDAPKHEATAREPLAPALELYRLSPGERPDAADAGLLWDMGQAVHGYIARVVAAGLLCPWRGSPRPGRRSVRH